MSSRASLTPLSDCISALVANETPETLEQLWREMIRARFGVIAVGAPSGVTGLYRVGRGEVGLGQANTPDGRLMILACADPVTFRQRFADQGFNADIDARSLFLAAMSNNDCQGVLINSATSTHSLPVSREEIEVLLRRTDAQCN
jgi:hypothetical protein